jgi:hypothetical protein
MKCQRRVKDRACGGHAGSLVPLCRDSGGGLLCVDVRDGEDSRLDHAVVRRRGPPPPDWASLTDVLAEIADRLEQHPVRTGDGALIWP